jgi:hypothetical protein
LSDARAARIVVSMPSRSSRSGPALTQRARFALLVACLAPVAACSPFAVYPAAKTEAASALNCPRDAIHSEHVPGRRGYVYAFEGCGRRARVRCMQSPYEIVCVPM